MKKRLITLVTINCVLFIVLTELFSFIYLSVSDKYKSPTFVINRYPKTADINEHFGAWHIPNTKFRHKSECFDVINNSNSYGARDIERSRESDDNRIIILGDSMVEGYGVEEKDRFSNILEQQIGHEVLNFATSGSFGTTQMRLLYEHLAKDFEHDIVIFGLFPTNDFLDDSYEYQLSQNKKRYRPLLVKDQNNNYNLNYSLTSVEESDWSLESINNQSKNKYINRVLVNYTHTGALLNQLNNNIKRTQAPKRKQPVKVKVKKPLYIHEEVQKNDLEILEYNLLKTKEALPDTSIQILFTTIPVKRELIYFKSKINYSNNLALYLNEFAEDNRLIYIDIVSEIVDNFEKEEIAKLYHSCDGHLSPYGHQVVANILKSQLTQIMKNKFHGTK